MKPFLSVAQCQKADELTQKFFQIDSFGLMQKVAKNMASHIMSRWDKSYDFLILTGPGNNGGDGFCVAEYLRRSGYQVRVCSLIVPTSEDAKKARRFYKGSVVESFDRQGGDQFLERKNCIIIDAVFGLRGKSQLPPPVGHLFRRINQSLNFRIALDCPSGINLQNESFDLHSFRAGLTLTVGFFKTGFLNPKLLSFCGEVQVVARDFIAPHVTSADQLWGLEWSDHCWSERSNISHKGTFGRVAIVGGSAQTPGAPFLAAEAAGRAGAGYVSVFLDADQKLSIRVKDASFILRTRWSRKDLESQKAFVLGCGGFNKKYRNYFKSEQRCVWDADGLAYVPKLRSQHNQWIMTPHPGEAAKLLKLTLRSVTNYPLEAAQKISQKWGATVYLKGTPSYLILPNWCQRGAREVPGRCYVNLLANQVFARAGTGDLLSGMMGAALLRSDKSIQQCAIDALLIQRAVGEVLRNREGVWTSDQLSVFSEAFALLRSRAYQETKND